MPLFVHLAPETLATRLARGGIAAGRARAGLPRGVFAMPVTRDFYVSHQWLRELRRRGPRTLVGVYFRIPDDEPVWLGHYGAAHRALPAAAAAGEVHRSERAEGWEVLVPRRIEAREIHRVRRLPQVVGWRYWPEAHGRRPCVCDWCQRGQFGARQVRARAAAREARATS